MESSFGLRDGLELTMEAFDDIGGVHDPADIFVILEIVGKSLPVPASGFNHLGIPGSPVRLQLIQISFRLFSRGSLIKLSFNTQKGTESMVESRLSKSMEFRT